MIPETLTALQAQQSWASTKNVTVLAANGNYPRGAVTGSGIYSGRAGALDMYVTGVEGTRIMKAQVPYHVSSATKLRPISLNARKSVLLPNDLSQYNVRFLDFSQSKEQSGDLCQGQICCSYAVKVTERNSRLPTVCLSPPSYPPTFSFTHASFSMQLLKNLTHYDSGEVLFLCGSCI